jgi:hypothetical protein
MMGMGFLILPMKKSRDSSIKKLHFPSIGLFINIIFLLKPLYSHYTVPCSPFSLPGGAPPGYKLVMKPLTIDIS